MTASANSKKLFPCLLLLVTIAVCQYLVLVAHRPVVTYLRSKIADFSFPLQALDVISRNQSLPQHVLILSYARTGSSFLGDLLQSYPKAFYHFEPLHFLSSSVINTSHAEARQLLAKLFHCEVTQLPGFLSWQKSHKNYMKLKRNSRFWRSCTNHNSCYNASYIDTFCSRHNVVIIKTIRMTLREATKLFKEYPELNLKIIYLARDPRATLNSRTQVPVRGWCRKDPKCFYAKNFCNTLTDDSLVACDLAAKRPNDFTIIRYEDLANEPFVIAQRLAKMLGFTSIREVENFLKSHTTTTMSPKKLVDGVDFPYTTFRNSAVTASKWRQEMPFVRAARVQKDCLRVLEWLGYHQYTTSGMLRSNVNFDKNLQQSLVNYCSEL